MLWFGMVWCPPNSLQNGVLVPQTVSITWVGILFSIVFMAKMPVLQKVLQAHSESTFNIKTFEGVRSHLVQTNRWGVHANFVAGNHFTTKCGAQPHLVNRKGDDCQMCPPRKMTFRHIPHILHRSKRLQLKSTKHNKL